MEDMLEPRDFSPTALPAAYRGFNAFFHATYNAAYIVPVTSCHTLSLFVPMHTLAHNVETLYRQMCCAVCHGDRSYYSKARALATLLR
jgi:hypothetical protein